MKTRILFLMISLSFSLQVFGQKEGNIWYFGENAGINFNSNAPFVANTNNMSTREGCATICDANGNLLFYTNGGGRDSLGSGGQAPGIIWNQNDDIMYDMGGLEGGGWSSRQSSVIVPKPNDANNYYLFTMDEVEATLDGTPGRGLSFFEIDMNQNGGLGGVVNYQEALELETSEALSVCRHTNGQDYWVFIINTSTNSLNIFSATSSGVSFSSSQSLAAANNATSSPFIKFSPEGTKFFAKNILFDFNPATGQVSNPLPLTVVTDQVTGVSFSPNSQFLYFVTLGTPVNSTISRLDVTASNIPASYETISSLPNAVGAQMQVGPDGNIYYLEQNVSGATIDLSVVQCANSASPCVENGIISYQGGFLGLPNFADHIFANTQLENTLPITINIEDLSQLCLDQPTNLTINTSPNASITWSTGENTSSIEILAEGTYSVTVNDGCCNVRTDEIEVDCQTSSIDGEQFDQKKAIKIYPNPAKDKIYVETSNEFSPIQEVEIYTIESKFVSRNTDSNIQEIEINDLESGVYIIRLITKDKTIINERILKF